MSKFVGQLLISIMIGLFLAEGVVRVVRVDWNYIHKRLYYQMVDLPSHQPDPDPQLLYRLKPGYFDYGKYAVNINSLGFRGPERPMVKPDGGIRIICVGASNVYGIGLQDIQTWPAQLELKLAGQLAKDVEVWNLGTPGYVGSQMAAIAREAIERFDPDLILIALSNLGAPPFLGDTPVEDYFNADPEFWRKFFPPAYLNSASWLSMKAKLRLVSRVHILRYLLVAHLRINNEQWSWRSGDLTEEENVGQVRSLLSSYEKKGKIALVLCPHESCQPIKQEPYYVGLSIPVLTLKAEGLPEEFTLIHPPAQVMHWYGSQIADWLIQNKLLPQ